MTSVSMCGWVTVLYEMLRSVGSAGMFAGIRLTVAGQ